MRAEKLGIFRKEGIAILNHTIYLGKKKFRAVFQGKRVELSSANDEQGTVFNCPLCLIQGTKDTHAVTCFEGSAKHPVFATGERAGE